LSKSIFLTKDNVELEFYLEEENDDRGDVHSKNVLPIINQRF